MLALFKSKEYTLESIDKKNHPTKSNTHQHEKSDSPSTIGLKQNMLVKLVGGKFSIDGGFING